MGLPKPTQDQRTAWDREDHIVAKQYGIGDTEWFFCRYCGRRLFRGVVGPGTTIQIACGNNRCKRKTIVAHSVA